jgi:hypothetical protein
MSRDQISAAWDGPVFRACQPPVEPVAKRVRHRRHLILTVCTGGVWGVLVWWWLPLWVRARNLDAQLQYASDLRVYADVQELRRLRATSAAQPRAVDPEHMSELPTSSGTSERRQLPRSSTRR